MMTRADNIKESERPEVGKSGRKLLKGCFLSFSIIKIAFPAFRLSDFPTPTQILKMIPILYVLSPQLWH